MKEKLNLKRLTSIAVILTFIFSTFLNFPVLVSAENIENVYDLVEITDFHGALTDASNNPTAAVLADRIEKIKEQNPEKTLILSGGDLYQGSATSNIMKGVPVKDVMSEIGLEVTALGNHEFDWGLNTIIDTTMKDASYSIVCANLYDKNSKKRVFEPYKIINKAGLKIAVIGGITTETPSIVLPQHVKDYEFRDLTSEISSVAEEIHHKKLADVVLVLVHEGDNRDNATGPIFDMANNLNNVDAVFGGHTHTCVSGIASKTKIPVFIGNAYGKGFIHVKFKMDQNNKAVFENPSLDKDYVDLNNESGYKGKDVQKNIEVSKIVDKAKKDVEPIVGEKIGVNTEKDLTRRAQVKPYGSSVLGNWATDVTKEIINADASFQNNGGLRIDIPTGELTVETMWKFMPFDNTVYKLSMKKSDIKAVLEQSIADNGKGLQVSGIKFTYDSNRNSGDRVLEITREDGSNIKDNEVLTVAVPDFLATGGDGFTAFKKCGGNNPENDTHIIIRNKFIEWCRKNKDKNGDNTIPNYCVERMTNVASTITLLATTDVHGSVLNYDYATGEKPEKSQGLAKISTYVNNIRKSNKNVLLVDNGDAIQGTPLVYYYNMIDTTTEYPMAKVMGAMKYDCFTLGNHEFNYGLDKLQRVIDDFEKESVKVLGANIYKISGANEDQAFVSPYIIKSFNINNKEVKVAVIGLENKCVPCWEDKDHYKGLEFRDLVEEAQKWVNVVKEKGADIVVISAHSGENTSGSSESEVGLLPENQADAIATNVVGVDAIVAGHAHLKVNDITKKNPEGKIVPIVESKKFATGLAQFDFNLDNNGKLVSISTKNVIMDDSIEEDKKIVDLIKPYNDKALEYVNTKIGISNGEFLGKGQTLETTPIMELINKVQKESAGTDLSIAAPLSSKCFIPKGDITIRDIMSVYVFENYLYGVKMTGKQIKDWLEYSARYYSQISDENKNIKKDITKGIPDFNLDQLYGATYDIDLTEPACEVDETTGKVINGNRIKNLRVNGKEVRDDDIFTVAINNYRFNGGGNYMKAVGLNPSDSDIVTYDSAKLLGDDGQIRSLITQYIKTNKQISPICSNNWRCITCDEELKNVA